MKALKLYTDFGTIDNDLYRQVMTSNKGIEMTYQYLRRNIVRGEMTNRYGNEVYNKFYRNGKLAASISEKELSKKLFVSNHTIRRNIEILSDCKLIKVDELSFRVGGSFKKSQKVYILGDWTTTLNDKGDDRKVEYLYSVDIFNNPFNKDKDEIPGILSKFKNKRECRECIQGEMQPVHSDPNALTALLNI